MFIQSFIFSDHFILVIVAVDPESILGTLATIWEYILRGHISLGNI